MNFLAPSTSFIGTGDVDLVDSEHAQISDQLWNTLGLREADAAVAISLTGPSNRLFPSFICWAKQSSSVDYAAVPRQIQAVYPNAMRPERSNEDKLNCSITSVTPIPLEEVILVANSQAAYTLAQTDREGLERQVSQDRRIIRQGALLSISEKCNYKVFMTMPIHQGYIEPQTTRIIIAAGMDSHDYDTAGSPAPSSSGLETGDDPESEIDETFLLNSVLGSNSKAHETLANGNGGAMLFHAKPLHNSRWLPQDQHQDVIAFVRTADLAKLGIFSGDWVVISNPEDRSTARLVRVLGVDGFDGELETGYLTISPILLNNLAANQQTPQSLTVLQSPFGQKLPPVPTARSITLARIATPISVQKRYQNLVLTALRQYFQTSKRLLKKGDLIALPINASSSIILDGLSENEGKASNLPEELLNQPSEEKPRMDGVVHFRVTHVEHDIAHVNGDTTPDSHFAALMGELGCWMEPEVTRLTQGGLENALVPDLSEYLDLEGRDAQMTNGIRESVLCTTNSNFSQLRDLMAATLHPAALVYQLSVTVLLTGSRGVGKRTLARWVAQDLGMHILEVDCYELVDDTDMKTEGALLAKFEQAEEVAPSVLLLRNIDALGRTNQKLETGKEPAAARMLDKCISDMQSAWSRTGHPTIVLATVRDADILPLSVLANFKHQINLSAPDEEQRLAILNNIFSHSSLGADVSLEAIATQTAALVADDLVDLASRVHVAASQRISSISAKLGITTRELSAGGFSLIGADFENGLSQARASFSASIGAPSIPKVAWDDVGGLASVKSDILDTIQLPLQHPELFADGVKKRSGILLFGPPGTGKTLLAKAVATSFSLNFFSIKGPELLNMYIGESEANVRRVFQRARDARPCVIFFDELDSVAPKRGNHGDSGGVMDRIVSQLLAELDGMSDGGGGDVFVIGATNRPDLLDPALLRPGRFDKLLYLGVSETHDAQLKIMEALTRKFRLDPNLDLRVIAEQCPFNYTGADFYALCSDAMLKAMSRKAAAVDAKILLLNSQPHLPAHSYPITPQYYLAEMASEEDTDVVVAQEDFMAALKELVASVSSTEMEHYRQIQQRFTNPSRHDE